MRTFVSSAISTPFPYAFLVSPRLSHSGRRATDLRLAYSAKRVPSPHLPVYCPLLLLPALAAINHRILLYLGAPNYLRAAGDRRTHSLD